MKPASASPVAIPTMFCSATPALKKRCGKALGERLERGEAEIAGQQDDPLVLRRELDERLDEFTSHRTLTSSFACASAYSSSDIGR